MHPDIEMSICIINGYPKASREKFDLTDTGHPHDMYKAVLKKYVPEAHVDVVFIADPDASLPEGVNICSYDGYIWTGSDLTIYHLHDPRVVKEIEFAKAVYRAGVPQYGSCWGIQMAATAAGGEVKKNPRGREWNFAPVIRRTEEGKRSLLLKGKPDEYQGFVMHLDEVTKIPPGGKLLAAGEHTRVQALEVHHDNGVFWATQYHPEYDLYEMARLIAARVEPLIKEGFFETEEQVMALVADMKALYKDPNNEELRKRVGANETIIDDGIRQQELHNWIDYLVIPHMRGQ